MSNGKQDYATYPVKKSARTVELVRVGTIDRDISYPGKQVVRLKDMSGLYQGGSLAGLSDAKKATERYKRGKKIQIEPGRTQRVPDFDQAGPALENMASSIEDLYNRLAGKTLSGVNVDIWDQISGAYLGAYNTDEHGTLVLPTDKQFVEVIQWQLRGGGYSDAFNGERAAGTPGLFFYFPCNEGTGRTISSFPGVSGQQAELPDGWGWYPSGFFNRPALKIISETPQPLQLFGAEPQGKRSFQLLWYCSDPTQNSNLFSYSGTIGTGTFNLSVTGGYLQGSLGGVTVPPVSGTTTLQANTWYLLQINTTMWERWNPDPQKLRFEYMLQMDIYLGSALELTVATPYFMELSGQLPVNNLVAYGGDTSDGLDEIRHLDRELYLSELTVYALFLRNGRVSGKSQGSTGTIGWN